jgi:SAM-dependent methyltransferase
MNLFLPKGYRENPIPAIWEPPKGKTLFQVEVYKHAAKVAEEEGLSTILDVGCGVGDKRQELTGFKVVGLDCVDRELESPYTDFLNHNLDDFQSEFEVPGYCLVLLSDVIEHLKFPRLALRKIKKASAIVISTPDRVLLHDREHNGPPSSKAHVREWSSDEFHRLLHDAYPGRAVTITHTIACTGGGN